MTPTPKSEELRIEKTVFDLDSKADVDLVKVVPDWQGISTVAEFNTRLGADHTKILAVLNKGLREYEAEQLATQYRNSLESPRMRKESLPISREPQFPRKSPSNWTKCFSHCQNVFWLCKGNDSGLRQRSMRKTAKRKRKPRKKALEFF